MSDYIIIWLQIVDAESNGSEGYNFPEVPIGDLANETQMFEYIALKKIYLEGSKDMFNYNRFEHLAKLNELIGEFKDLYLKLKFDDLTKTVSQILPLLYYQLSKIKIKSGVLRVSKFDYTQHSFKFAHRQSFIPILDDALKLLRNSMIGDQYNLSILILTSLMQSFDKVKVLRADIPLDTLYGINREKFKRMHSNAAALVKYVASSKKKGGFWCVVDQ